MAEIQISGPAGKNKDGFELKWGLDGWSEKEHFELVLTSPYNEGIASLSYKQCSMLIAALTEHMKEVRNAQKESID